LQRIIDAAKYAHSLGLEVHAGHGLSYETAGPVAAILGSLPAFVADLASQLNKQVALDIEGAEIKIDQSTLSHVSEMVTELLGWILIHDMEETEERVRLGKPRAGRIAVKILQNGNSVQVVVESDGRGLDQRQIAAHDIPGMDFAAVNNGLRAFRGGLMVARGAMGGTRFAVHIPLSQNVMDGIIVRIGKVRYVVPLDVVRQIMRPEPGQVISSSINGGKSLNLRGEIIPLRLLAGEAGNGVASYPWERMVVVVDAARQAMAFPIDEIVGQQQVLINPLNGFMKGIKGVAGCAILGGGEVGLILDIDSMAEKDAPESCENTELSY
jgi:two-component system chemotaxis sensor kinase CheA